MQSRKNDLEKILSLMAVSGSIAIFPHTGADGDAIGSGCALKAALETWGKRAVVIVDSPVVSRYTYLPHSKDIAVYDRTAPSAFMSNIFSGEKADMAVLIDCSAAERIGICSELLDHCGSISVIDHHYSEFCTVRHCSIDKDASSTGEMIYDLIELMEVRSGRSLFDRDITENLLAAIYFDTGGLRYSNTTGRAFGISKDLFERFAPDFRTMIYNIFERTPLSKICIQAKAFSSVRLLYKGRIAACVITNAMINECSAEDDDMDGICTAIRNIEGVEVAFVIREQNNGNIRVNIRSSDSFDSAGFARGFSGGGHRRAAGFSLSDVLLDDAVDMIIKKSICALSSEDTGGS